MYVGVGESNEVEGKIPMEFWMTAMKKMIMIATTFCVDFVTIIILSMTLKKQRAWNQLSL